MDRKLRDDILQLACGVGWNTTADTDPAAALRLLRGLEPGDRAGDLCLAALAGEASAVRARLAAGADASAPTGPRDWAPLVWLAFSLLHREAPELSRGQCDAARALLAAGADPNRGYRDPVHADVPFPPLYGTIAVSRHLALGEVLLEGGARASDSQSLYHACEWFDLAPLELLGRYGLEAEDISYCIKHALDMGNAPAVRWFLARGADPNARHPGTGQSTLHWAVHRNAGLDLIAELLAAGADPNLRAKVGASVWERRAGGTPLDVALYYGRLDVAELLRGAGGVPTEPDDQGRFLQACAAGDGATARAYLAAVPDALARLPIPDRHRVSDVAWLGSLEAVRLMLDCGFDPSARGWMGATPLHWAACLAKRELLELLLERGAPQLDVGGYFKTPLHAALHCAWAEADYVPIVSRLMEAGAVVPADLARTGKPELDRLVWG